MDIDPFLFIGLKADRNVGEKLTAAPLHKKRINALVGGAVPCAQREKTTGVEARIPHRCRRRSAVANPSQALRKIEGVSALDSAAIKFTEHAAPVPLSYLLFSTDLFPCVTK